MGEEKRKTATADEATENPQKLPRLDAAAAEELLDLSNSSSTEEGEMTTGDSTYDIGCKHLFKDSEALEEIVCELKDAVKPPTCDHYRCRTTWTGPAGMLVCTDCSSTFCTGEKGDRENPRGHAAWHAVSCQHWVALWCDEPSNRYCFECGHVIMLGQNKLDEDDYALVPRNKKDESGIVASNSKDTAMLSRNVKVDWGMASSYALDPCTMLGSNAMGRWGVVGSNAMDYVIRGIPNLTYTCYVNASLQCLLALGNLRTMILRPDARLGNIGLHLKHLFIETSSANNAIQMLNPKIILEDMWSLYPKLFKPKEMGDSHEFITSLCSALDNEVEQQNKLHTMEADALFPTFGNSIFMCELLETISCKICSHTEVRHQSCHCLQLALPSKDPPARSRHLQVDSTELKDTIHGHLQTQKNDVLTADFHNPEDKEKAQNSDIVHDVAERMNSLPSIEDCLKLFSHDLTDCNKCSEGVTSGKSCGEKDIASCSTANEKTESHEGVQEAAPSCLTTDEQTDVLSAQYIGEQPKKYDHSAQKVAEKQNKLTGGNGGAIQTQLISKLPPVLTIQLKRMAPDLSKLSDHVNFEEILYVGPFMDPSSEDKDNSSYRLVGVIEHIGVNLNRGHYKAYVREGRGQQGSEPSSWVCANDSIIQRVSLEEVLKCQAYILFYERIDD